MSKPTLGDLNVRIDLDVSGLTPEARWMKESSHLIPARPLTPAEFDSIARGLGYVRGDLDPLGASPAEGGGIEFYFGAWGEGDDEHTSFVAETWMLDDQGWVKRPVCGACEGLSNNAIPCRSCGTTGFGRLVALDGIDVEKLRDALDTDISVTNRHDAYGSPYAVADMIADDAWIVWEFARQVLAALDGGSE